MKDGQQASSIHEAGQAWLSDGTASTPPVTTSTPAEPTPAPAAPETPAAAPAATPPAAPAAGSGDAPASTITGTSLSERTAAWVKDGVKQVSTQAAADAAAAGATPGEQAAAAQAAAQSFMEAQLDGKPYQIPSNVLIPVKVNGKTEYHPLSTVQGGLMMDADYRRKTQALAEQRRAVEADSVQVRAEAARQAEMQRQLAEERRAFDEARNDPEKMAELEEHQRLYATNTIYRQQVDNARAKAVSDAALAVYEQEATQTTTQAAVESIVTAISTFAADYPGVDPEVVRAQYAEALVAERADLTEESLRSFFAAEAARVATVAAPFKSELETLKGTVKQLQEQLAAAAAARDHNDNADRILARDEQGRFTKPSSTAPAVGAGDGSKRSEPYAGSLTNGTNARHKAWANGT